MGLFIVLSLTLEPLTWMPNIHQQLLKVMGDRNVAPHVSQTDIVYMEYGMFNAVA